MSEPEEEDLTKFDLDDLIKIANKVAEEMVREKVTREGVERLFKVSSELRKRVCGNPQKGTSSAVRRPPPAAVARPDRGTAPSRTAGILPRRGRT
jgi:hypothetical protein